MRPRVQMTAKCIAAAVGMVLIGQAADTTLAVSPTDDLAARVEQTRSLPRPVTLCLASGLYLLPRTLALGPEDSGLVIEAAPGADVTLSGGRRIVGWTRNADGTWSAPVPKNEPFRQLTVSGVRAPRCRAPNGGEFLMAGETVAFDKTMPTHTAGARKHPDMLYDPKDIDFARLADPSTGEIRVFHWWVDSHLTIGRVDPASNRVVFARPADLYVGFMRAGGKPCRYRAENFRELLDEPGEWFLDAKAGRVDYLPRKGEDPSSDGFVAVGARLRQLVTLTGDPVTNGTCVSGVTFRNIRFRDADAQLRAGDINSAQGSATIGAAIVLRGARNCRFEGCVFEALDGFALDILDGSRGTAVVRCDFHDLGGGAVRINGGRVGAHPAAQTRGNEISDCEIRAYGLDWASACGILIRNSAENLVSHNWIHDGYYTAVSTGWVWGYGDSVARGNVVAHNLIEDIGKGLLNDMGGIYTLGLQPGGVIRNNVIRRIRRWSYGGHAIYNDEGSQGLLVENNLCHDAPDVYNIHYGREITVRNNIFAQAGDCLMHGGIFEPHVTAYLHGNIFYTTKGRFRSPWEHWLNPTAYEFTTSPRSRHPGRRRDFNIADWNLFWNPNMSEADAAKQFREGAVNAHSLWADPKFVDPARGDFRLRPDSPALRIGFEPIDFRDVGPRGRLFMKTQSDSVNAKPPPIVG